MIEKMKITFTSLKSSMTALVITLLCCSTVMAQYHRVNDIPYRQTGNDYALERCKLDVYYPDTLRDAPVVVWFHGGGLMAGSKDIPQELQQSGYVVIGVNYRLLPKATIDECIDDAAAAVAWAFHNAVQYHGSPSKVFVTGHSAGGYLTDLIGLDKHWLAAYGIDADSIAGLLPLSGQVITHYNVRKLQDGRSPLDPTIDQYAPLAHLRADAPPIVIISGDRELELYGRYEEQAYFWRMLRLVGHTDATLYELQGYPHGEMHHPAFYIVKQQIRRILSR